MEKLIPCTIWYTINLSVLENNHLWSALKIPLVVGLMRSSGRPKLDNLVNLDGVSGVQAWLMAKGL